MLRRPYVCATWRPYFEWKEPMWGVDQLKNEDVQKEMDRIRREVPETLFLFLGGDGLSIGRVNSHISREPDVYLSPPMVIPMMGNFPHGLFHVMHAGWRLYFHFIRACTNHLGISQAVKDNPSVKDTNNLFFQIVLMTVACCEYLLLLMESTGAPNLLSVPDLIEACERNVDLAFLIHFVYDLGALVIQFKQTVAHSLHKRTPARL